MQDKLVWKEELGIGYYPVEETPYDAAYFEKYVGYEKTEIGKKLNKSRVDLVNKYSFETLVDIGIGSGQFVKSFENAQGSDINPVAVQWLKDNNRLYKNTPVDAMTFWDCLEHIHDPTELLSKVKKYVFVSCPIFTDKDHVLRSKHFRTDEHCWYFTEAGLCLFMACAGFTLVEKNRIEEECGREDIGTFVFKKET